MRFDKLALDLFCGAGGAARGLQQAGFYVVGIDHEWQPRYCGDEFIQADALDVLSWVEFCRVFDFIWASPPCQAYSILNNINAIAKNDYPDLIGITRKLLKVTERPFVIENVPGAPLHRPVTLCGSMFGLKVYRHRLFETSFHLPQPAHSPHRDKTPSAGQGISPKGFISIGGNGGARNLPRGFNTLSYMRYAMDIDWMGRHEIAQAVPPAYARYIGEWFLHKRIGPIERPVQLTLLA